MDETGDVVGLGADEVGGLGSLDVVAEVLGRAGLVPWLLLAAAVLVGAALVGTVLVGVVLVGVADDVEPLVDVRDGPGEVLVGSGLRVLSLGAGAWKSSWAGRCRRAGSAPATAATASPVMATNTAAAAIPTRVVKRVAR